jgi:SAM-dependent methyltransferase
LTYAKSVPFYDLLYHWKHYPSEVEKLRALIAHHQRRESKTLLDVGCGTGMHLSLLRDHFDVQGVDASVEMLAVARQRLGEIMPLHQGDIRAFEMGRQFDVAISMFGVIGHAITRDGLQAAATTLLRHVTDDGLLLLEPWIFPQAYKPGGIHSIYAKTDDLHVARMNVARREANPPDVDISYLDFQYMIGTPAGIEMFSETLTLGLFSEQDYLDALSAAGAARIVYDLQGVNGRGLYIVQKI